MDNCDDKDIPYGHVRVHCNVCGETYFVRAKELKKKVNSNNGWFPCEKCGSHETSWEFRK